MTFTFDSVELEIVRNLRDAGRFADAYSFISRRLRGLSVWPGDFPCPAPPRCAIGAMEIT